MTIRAADVNVHLDRPPISGTMLLHDDDTHVIVPVDIRPMTDPPGYFVRAPLGDTLREDFDDYRREAERILHTLTTVTSRDVSDRDRHVGHVEAQFHIADPERDVEWQQIRWRYLAGDTNDLTLNTEATQHAQGRYIPHKDHLASPSADENSKDRP